MGECRGRRVAEHKITERLENQVQDVDFLPK